MATMVYQEVDQDKHNFTHVDARFRRILGKKTKVPRQGAQKRHSGLRHDLEDRGFLLRSDNKALTWLLSLKDE
jgi:hypothetical protein